MTAATPTAANVAAFKPAVSGGVLFGVTGTSLPTDASTSLTNFTPLGYISEDGIQPSRDTSIEKVKSWEGDVVAALLTDDSQSFVFKLIEVFQEDVNKFLYGSSNVTYSSATSSANTKISIKDKAFKPLSCVLVFEMVYGAKKARVIVPAADISVTGEDPYVAGGVAAYEVTVEALKDSSGVRAYRYYELDDKTA